MLSGIGILPTHILQKKGTTQMFGLNRWIDKRIQKALTKSTPEGNSFVNLMDIGEHSRYSIFADGVNGKLQQIYGLFKSTCDAFERTVELQGARIIALEAEVKELRNEVEPRSGTGTVGSSVQS